ncbi:hypothetical protein ABT255_03465 [Streptomyces mirabilis]|uniref:C2H2-type zinc finger protein n=1 Tax=Streptomyces mirabilis TaxID=68239 RepID=UPI00331AE99D
MSRAFITVQPARDLRTAFARWAVAQDPKVRTVSPVDFAVPYGLFTSVPEQLLVGAVVDGHAYVIPDEPEPTDPASGLVLLGVDQPEREGIPGEPLPEVPVEAYPPDAVPLDVQPADVSDRSDAAAEDGQPKCPDCDRPFKSDRALAAHRRQAHPED